MELLLIEISMRSMSTSKLNNWNKYKNTELLSIIYNYRVMCCLNKYLNG